MKNVEQWKISQGEACHSSYPPVKKPILFIHVLHYHTAPQTTYSEGPPDHQRNICEERKIYSYLRFEVAAYNSHNASGVS